MQVPLQITVRDMPTSEALENHIRDKVQKLDAWFGRLVSCRVVVEVPHKHHQQGKQFNVRLDLGVPGNELVVNRDHHEDPYVALRDAFLAARRQLEDYSRRLRRETKKHAIEQVGLVVRISHQEGFGFIAGPDGEERYFHRDNVASPTFVKLQPGDEVKFMDDFGNDGQQAKRVSVGRHHIPGAA